MVKEKLLLERVTLDGVNVNKRDAENKNALYWAIKCKSTYNANLLISFGSSLLVTTKKHAIFHAIECKHHEIVVLLIQKGLDVNIKDDVGKTLLMYAIESEMLGTVKFLINESADMYLMDDALNMAEDYAKECNSEDIQSYIQHTINIDMKKYTCNSNLCKCG